MSAFIYFAHSPRTGLVKIGRTGNVKRRLCQLSRMDGAPLTLLTAFETDMPSKDEYYLHVALDARRVCGEWFRLEDGDIEHARRGLKKHRTRWAELMKEIVVREEAKRVRRMAKWAGLKLSEVIA